MKKFISDLEKKKNFLIKNLLLSSPQKCFDSKNIKRAADLENQIQV